MSATLISAGVRKMASPKASHSEVLTPDVVAAIRDNDNG
jgi:hypothetical protein